MNKSIGVLLVIYSLLLAGFSYLIYHLSPGASQPALIAGLAGGALCLVCGLRALGGSGGKALPLLTLIVVGFTLLPQAFMSGDNGVQAGRTAAVVSILLLVLTLAMLARIAWSGVVFDMPRREATKQGDGQAQPGARTGAQAGKRS